LNRSLTFAFSVKKNSCLKRIRINQAGNGIWNAIVCCASVVMKRKP
jgi:hypothetical protein